MSIAEPALLALLAGSAVPAMAAVLTLVFVKRPGKWREFFARLNPLGGTKIGFALKTYCVIFALLIPILFLALYFRQLTGGDYTGSLTTFSFAAVLMILTAAFLDQGAVLEELGWRGFAVPELQRTINSPLAVALFVGVLWGLWHLPRDITTGVIDRLGAVDYVFLYLPSFLTGTISVSVIASYFMNRLGGSIIPAVIVHGITNDSVGISGSASIVEALTPYHQFTKNSLFALVAIAIVIRVGASLGRRQSDISE
jgi:membrane protease YdiL (CAAX protease family)